MATLSGEYQNSNLSFFFANIASRDCSVTESDKRSGWERVSFEAERKDLKLQREGWGKATFW